LTTPEKISAAELERMMKLGNRAPAPIVRNVKLAIRPVARSPAHQRGARTKRAGFAGGKL
jgi:hypothetical protein